MSHLNRVAVWERTDGGISITHFDNRDMRQGETEDDFITRFTDRLKLEPVFGSSTMSLISASDIPTDRSERNEWSFIAGKVKVDPAKVAAKQAKEAERQAIFARIGVTEDEFRKIKR